jgi:hypothetical protein
MPDGVMTGMEQSRHSRKRTLQLFPEQGRHLPLFARAGFRSLGKVMAEGRLEEMRMTAGQWQACYDGSGRYCASVPVSCHASRRNHELQHRAALPL